MAGGGYCGNSRTGRNYEAPNPPLLLPMQVEMAARLTKKIGETAHPAKNGGRQQETRALLPRRRSAEQIRLQAIDDGESKKQQAEQDLTDPVVVAFRRVRGDYDSRVHCY